MGRGGNEPRKPSSSFTVFFFITFLRPRLRFVPPATGEASEMGWSILYVELKSDGSNPCSFVSFELGRADPERMTY